MRGPPELDQYRNRLQHWRMPDSLYFITWRLHPEQPELAPTERGIVANAIKHFQGVRYNLYAYVVMDDHVHVITKPIGECALSDVLHTWKSFTANQLQRGHGRVGSIWQKDTFERIIRSQEELLDTAEYILNNPRKRWPEFKSYQWVEWFKDQF